MSKIIAVARTTFRETIRNKVMLHLGGFAVAMLALGWVVSNWSLGEPEKIVADIGLAVTTLGGVTIAIFSGIVLVWGEVDRRTVLPILAKPLSRREFIVGKFLGFTSAVSLVYAGMNILLVLLLLSVGAHVTPQLLFAIYLSWWEIALVVALALLFSSFASPTMSALFTIMLFLSGRFSGDIRLFLDENPLSYSRPLLEAVYLILPHLDYFDLRVEAVYNLSIAPERIILPTLYGIFYCLAVLGVSAIAFSRRDLA